MGPRAVLLLAVAVAACGGAKKPAAPSAPPNAATCNTTKPKQAPDDKLANGNGELWVIGLPPGGVMEIEPQDGVLYMKLGWWRAVVRDLHASGRRIDAPAPPLRAEVPAGYHTGFQVSGLYFPAQGCWRVTGRIGDDGRPLTFVTFVVKR